MATLGEYIGAGSTTTKGLWHLNGSSADSSGNGNNGTDTAIPYSLANGKFGQGAGFNGTTSKIGLGTTLFSGYSALTISIWLNTNAVGNFRRAISQTNSSTYNQFIRMTNGNKFSFDITTSTEHNIDGNTTISSGVWYNVIGTYDGSNLRLYVNGQSDATPVAQTGNIATHSEIIYLGQENSGSEFWSGMIDEVIVENRAWSASEIKKYYTNAKGRFGII